MNMRPKLSQENLHHIDLADIADLQIHIRRAVVENDLLSANYLDNLLKDKHTARVAALYIAQNLYDICKRYPEPIITIIEFKPEHKPRQLTLWGAS